MSPLRLVLIIKCDCGVASSGLTSLPHASMHKVGLSNSFCPSLHLSVSLSVLVPKIWRMQVQLWHLETQQKQSPIGKSRRLFSATSKYWAYCLYLVWLHMCSLLLMAHVQRRYGLNEVTNAHSKAKMQATESHSRNGHAEALWLPLTARLIHSSTINLPVEG